MGDLKASRKVVGTNLGLGRYESERERERDLGLGRFDQKSNPELRESNRWKWFTKKKKKKTNIIESDSKACTEPILGLGQNCPLRSSSWSYIVCNLAKAFGVCIFNWVCIGS